MRWLAAVLTASALLSWGAQAHEGAAATTEAAQPLVEQAIGFLSAEPPDVMEAAERIDAALAATDQRGVDRALVRVAKSVLELQAAPEALALLQRALGLEEVAVPASGAALTPAGYVLLAAGLVLVGIGGFVLGRQGRRAIEAAGA